MGKPAARLTDSTAHGGVVTGAGCPTVLIQKMPAACLGDMHVCPMATPAVPPVPHVGGPITLGSMGVLIGGRPAARLGDMATCVGPPSSIIMGCFTVLIGESASGSQAGSPGSASAAKSAQKTGPAKVKAAPVESPDNPKTENHYIDCEFVDSAGKPLSAVQYKITDPDNKEIIGTSTADGKARHDGYAKAGSFKVETRTIANCKWSKNKAQAGDTLELSADIDGFEDGMEIALSIFKLDSNVAKVIDKVKAKISNKKIKVNWTPPDAEKESLSETRFCVVADTVVGLSSNALVKDYAEIELVDSEGKGKSGEPYKITFEDGTIREGKLDSSGKAREEDIPSGKYTVVFGEEVKAAPPPTGKGSSSSSSASSSQQTSSASGGTSASSKTLDVEIKNENGAPIADSYLRLGLNSDFSSEIKTDGEGKTTVEDAPENITDVSVEPSDFILDSDETKVHKVVEGDTLSKICETYYGDMMLYPIIAEINNIENPDLIYPDDEIKMPPELYKISNWSSTSTSLNISLHCIHLTYVLKGIVFVDEKGKPLINAKYIIKKGDEENEGCLDGDGNCQDVKPETKSDFKIFFPDET